MQPIAPINAAQNTEPSTGIAPAVSAFDASAFARENRIHIEDGSHFLPFHYLMIAPKELAPENQRRTFAKLVKHLTIPAPSFLSVPQRAAVMESMAAFLPISQEARLLSMKEATEKLKIFAETGIHPDNVESLDKYQRPFVAFAKLRSEKPKMDAVTREYLDNAVLLYLVVNEALSQRGRPQEPASYVTNFNSHDSVMSALADKLGLSLTECVELLQTKGINGFAEKMGIAPATLEEMKTVVQKASEHMYADNILLSWDVGRHVPGLEGRSIDDKIAVGVLQRAGSLMQMLQRSIAPSTQAPADVQKQEQMITAILREMPKPLQEALYYNGVEFGFIKGNNLSHVMPSFGHAAGVNMHVPFEYGSEDGMRLIINSHLENLTLTRSILHHEANHLFFPKQMGEEGIVQLDSLMRQGVQRLHRLKDKLDLWKVEGSPDKRRAIEAEIDAEFRVGKIGLETALARAGSNPVSIDTLHSWVDEALHNLNPDAPALSKGYPIPELRAAEIISRFAEMLFVKLQDNPALLGFIAPELMVGYHDIYLPHLERQVQQIKSAQQQMPENLRFLGLPPEAVLPQTQQAALETTLPVKGAPKKAEVQQGVSQVSFNLSQALDLPQSQVVADSITQAHETIQAEAPHIASAMASAR